MMNFRDYITSVRASGHYAFTTDQALKELGVSRNAFNCGMYKLRKKGEIISPARNLYVIIPPEYQSIGCLPADELIPILMKHWNLSYYVCLLSASHYYGASHQKPQVFQVMTNKQIKTLACGKIRINFIYKKMIPSNNIQKRVVKTGFLNVSNPELTVMDLLIYSHPAGGLNHIATVLSELIESVNIINMRSLISESSETAWIQRLGYLLEHIESMEPQKQDRVIELLHKQLATQRLYPVPLAPELPVKNMPRNRHWMIIENTSIESDL